MMISKFLQLCGVNGVQLVNLHINETNTDRTIKVGETYKDWDLISIDNNCVIFKNKVGVNKQCL